MVLDAYAPSQFRGGSLRVELDGVSLGEKPVSGENQQFQLIFPIPAEWKRDRTVQVKIVASQTFRAPGDPRELSVVFGTVQIQ